MGFGLGYKKVGVYKHQELQFPLWYAVDLGKESEHQVLNSSHIFVCPGLHANAKIAILAKNRKNRKHRKSVAIFAILTIFAKIAKIAKNRKNRKNSQKLEKTSPPKVLRFLRF